MPRKSLTQGDSPRITFRISNEIEEILSSLDKNERSAFMREAIVHYATSYAYRRKESTLTVSTVDQEKEYIEKEKPSSPIRVLHKPAWQR